MNRFEQKKVNLHENQNIAIFYFLLHILGPFLNFKLLKSNFLNFNSITSLSILFQRSAQNMDNDFWEY